MTHRVCGGAVGWGTALHAGRSWVRFLMVSLEFFIDIILLSTLWPWDWLSPPTEMSTRNLSWEGKGGRWVGLTTLPPSCAKCLEILKPQPPGTTSCPVQACDGIALPFNARHIVLPVCPKGKAVVHSGYSTRTVFQLHQKHDISKALC